MNDSPVIVAADGHVHFYPVFDESAAIRQLIRNLDRLAGVGEKVFKLALLTENRDGDFFRRLQEGNRSALGAGIDVAGGSENECLTVIDREVGQVCLVAGRQIVTRERLEILGLAMSGHVPDGLSAVEAIERVTAAGGVPVLAWSPGKWWFKRGRLARNLIEGDRTRRFCLGDTTLRPLSLPAPHLMRLGRQLGMAVIPGSDPLPLAGEERYLGAYGFVYRGPFDVVRPVASIRRVLADSPAAIEPVGIRCGVLTVVRRLYRLRMSK